MKNTMVYHCMKKKNLSSNDVNCYIYIVGWQMEPWNDVVGGGSICTGKYYLGLKNQCRQRSCAENEALTMRLGMGRESHL
jgi:hypothetical protein